MSIDSHRCNCPILSLFHGRWDENRYTFLVIQGCNTFEYILYHRIRFDSSSCSRDEQIIICLNGWGRGEGCGQPEWIHLMESWHCRINKEKKIDELQQVLMMNFESVYGFANYWEKPFEKSKNKPTPIIISFYHPYVLLWSTRWWCTSHHYTVFCTAWFRSFRQKTAPTVDSVAFGFRGNKNHYV